MGNALFLFPWHLGEDIATDMNLAPLHLGFGKFFFEDPFQPWRGVHDPQSHTAAIEYTPFRSLKNSRQFDADFLLLAYKPDIIRRPLSATPVATSTESLSMVSSIRIGKNTPLE